MKLGTYPIIGGIIGYMLGIPITPYGYEFVPGLVSPVPEAVSEDIEFWSGASA
eukprot:CAMPEP_0175177840 /NCGR_PEP_ID=MMETSP0087-20121206/34615_1 /TAXON_ID=136419 /ORGANISM="Unknown Unknown, Strain D1" /LENGTH=52 /DNA_ID=CAMNT_0016469873 /DNA_START=23 /DNA_END=181 /DNA_ORIENTATION=+